MKRDYTAKNQSGHGERTPTEEFLLTYFSGLRGHCPRCRSYIETATRKSTSTFQLLRRIGRRYVRRWCERAHRRCERSHRRPARLVSVGYAKPTASSHFPTADVSGTAKDERPKFVRQGGNPTSCRPQMTAYFWFFWPEGAAFRFFWWVCGVMQAPILIKFQNICSWLTSY